VEAAVLRADIAATLIENPANESCELSELAGFGVMILDCFPKFPVSHEMQDNKQSN
jgi:hypothetical protein